MYVHKKKTEHSIDIYENLIVHVFLEAQVVNHSIVHVYEYDFIFYK